MAFDCQLSIELVKLLSKSLYLKSKYDLKLFLRNCLYMDIKI